jgi:DNA-binding NarL/FixJ family response regulator
MVSAGLSSSQIAENRGVSVKAVEATISKIHSILGISKSKSLNKRVQIARKYFALAGKKPPGD